MARIRLEPERHGPYRIRMGRYLAFLAMVPVFIVVSALNGSRNVDAPEPTPTPKPTPDARFIQFAGECKTYGLAYRDPSSDAQDRKRVFGEPDDPGKLTQVSFMGYIVQVHEKVAPCLDAVERDLKDQGTTYQVKEIGGYREERKDRPYWFHQYGAGVDINPATNPICTADLGGDYEHVEEPARCRSEQPYDLPQSWIDTFERYGFYWGGNYEKGKDYMHFEWHGE